MVTSRWCQRYTEDGALAWQYADDPSAWFDDKWYEVHHITHAAAVAYCEQRHYLKTFPADQARFGLFHKGRLSGVAVFGVPTNVRVLTNWLPDLQPYVQAMAFQRLVLDDLVPACGETWFMARCRELLVARDVYGSVTFADPMRGHCGIIYQADNWTYAGTTRPAETFVLSTGFVVDRRAIAKVTAQDQGHDYVERALCAAGATPIRPGEQPGRYLRRAFDEARAVRRVCPGKHRYVRGHTPDVAIVHKGRRVVRDPARYPKPTPDLLDLIRETTNTGRV